MQAGAAFGWGGWSALAQAHHGWSSFDQDRPLYLEGRAASVRWRNPHAELVLDVPESLRLPPDLAQRSLPAQTASIDGPALLARTVLPTRRDRRWEIELAPLFRLGQWQVPEIKNGMPLSVVGFAFKDEKGEAILRAEYLFLDGKTYGLRSSPA
ncbi:hypothetical protein F9K07_14160 [Hydrogenophaga sp. BPS33]|nr:hypothetical protein F9K07_14160 [Hydrogenophaga sp. BPS33]